MNFERSLLYNDVMKVADTGFHPRGQCPPPVIPVLDTCIFMM